MSDVANGSENEVRERGSAVDGVRVSKPLLKLKLLESLRQGNFSQLKELIKGPRFQPLDDPDVADVLSGMINYAVQVSPMFLIKEVVKHWVTDADNGNNSDDLNLKLDLNYQDQKGNTPLHLACYQSRGDVVSFLMDQVSINDCIVNNDHLQAIEVCKNLNIAQMMQYKRSNYVAEIAQEFRMAFNNRDFGHLETILSHARNAELLDINGTDPETGDTVLHEFVKKRDVIMCRWLLEHGADPFKRDAGGALAVEILGNVNDTEKATNTKTAIDIELKKLLTDAAKDQSVIDINASMHEAPTLKGYLRKWTNFAQGYRLRWFVLSGDGKLSYYKDQADSRNACRGALNMSTCSIHLDSSEKLKFEIIGGTDDEVTWHLKGNHPVETNKWVWAIQGSIRFAKDREIMIANNRNKMLQTPVSPIAKKLPGFEDQDHLMVNHSNANNKKYSLTSDSDISSINNPVSRKPSINLSPVQDQFSQNDEEEITEIITHTTNPAVGLSLPDLNDQSTNQADISSAHSISGNSSDAENDQENMDLSDDEDDIKMQYGPYSQDLMIYQKTIEMELNNLTELLTDKHSNLPEWETIQSSLKTITEFTSNLNNLTSKRDEKLLSMLSKQRDVNNIWIQSVKDLELELIDKTERLENLDKERKNFKKMLQTNLAETNDDNNNGTALNKNEGNSDTLEEVAKYIQATVTEGEESDVDEFFDAEDLVEASEKFTDTEADDIDNQASVTSETTVIKGEIEDNLNKEENLEQVAETTTDTGTLVKYQSVNPVTEIQKATEKKMIEDGTFVGYEEPIRSKLTLSNDERPSVSLWSVLKSMVGKDITKIALPVTFNEPTSMLQRVSEDLEYSELLDQAALYEDSTLRLLYVAVFSLSPYSSTIRRVAKPFNPLLGETFEYARPDKHYRLLSEQVSHHPVITAINCESPKWDFWGSMNVQSNFNGRNFSFKQADHWHVKIRPNCTEEEDVYTWKKPENILIGILTGNPEIDSVGDVTIKNNTTGDYCVLHYKARGWRSYGAYEVRGEVYDKDGNKRWVLGGHWNDSCFAKKVTSASTDELLLETNKPVATTGIITSNSVYTTGTTTHDGSKFLVWKANKRPEGPFNLTSFAISLNANPVKLQKWLAPTDTRWRPDQRAMEDGEYDLAAEEKHRLEVKQRVVRREREEAQEEYKPRYFVQEFNEITQDMMWKYTGEYWSKRKNNDFADAYDIF